MSHPKKEAHAYGYAVGAVTAAASLKHAQSG